MEKYLDKCINYLDTIYSDILDMIYKYKEQTSKQPIEKYEDPIEQLNELSKEDNNRLGGRYNYEINKIKVLIETPINDKNNEMEYQKYRKILISQIPVLYNAIQHPENIDNINEILDIIDCDTECFTNMSSYYYTKLFEYWHNEDMEEILIKHFKDKITPFNNNIMNIRELYCLVIAYNYFRTLSR